MPSSAWGRGVPPVCVPAVAGMVLVGQLAGREMPTSAGGDFGGGFGQGGGIEWKHCSAPAVNASLHTCRYYFWSPPSGQVPGKGLFHVKHHFPGTLEWEHKDTNQTLPRAEPQASLSLVTQTARAHFALCSCCILGAPFSWKMSFPQGAGSCGNAEEKGERARLSPSGSVLH